MPSEEEVQKQLVAYFSPAKNYCNPRQPMNTDLTGTENPSRLSAPI